MIISFVYFIKAIYSLQSEITSLKSTCSKCVDCNINKKETKKEIKEETKKETKNDINKEINKEIINSIKEIFWNYIRK